MPVFESMQNPANTIFGSGGVSDTVRPGARPEAPGDFRHKPNLRNTFSGSSGEEIYGQWLDRAKFIAQEACVAANAAGRSATALARLAHASLAAEDPDSAASAATEALDKIIGTCKVSGGRPAPPAPDVPAVISAAWVLILCGKAELAEVRLSQLPRSLPVMLMRAGLAIDGSRSHDALELLADVDSPEVDCLRGYIYLKLDEPQRAIRNLRRAFQVGDPSADVCANLAFAFWRLGSRRKAINFVRQAARLAPGRKDISLLLIDCLINSYDFQSAEAEIRSILSAGAEDAPELLIRQAQIRFLSSDAKRSVALLRRAESMAKASEDSDIVAHVGAQIALVQYAAGEVDHVEAVRKVRNQSGVLTS